MAGPGEGLKSSIDTIEESYEFMLAYAAQGLSTHEASKSGAQLRDYLERTRGAIEGLADQFERVIEEKGFGDDTPYRDFLEVLRDDARKSNAALRLTMSQPAISSQLIDNLNASIHLRALLTDVFVLDEVLGGG